jgi:hypothetical protein
MADYAARNAQGHHAIADNDPQALRLLKDEHHRFRSLFDAAKTAKGAERVTIARELCMRLAVHMTIEEEILYPALKPIIGADEIDEGIVEHDMGKKMMVEIENLDGTEPLYEAKVHVLGEDTIHHIDEEDEEMFEDAKQAHLDGKIDLDAIGETMRARQAELYREIEQDGEIGETQEAVAEEIPGGV